MSVKRSRKQLNKIGPGRVGSGLGVHRRIPAPPLPGAAFHPTMRQPASAAGLSGPPRLHMDLWAWPLLTALFFEISPILFRTRPPGEGADMYPLGVCYVLVLNSGPHG